MENKKIFIISFNQLGTDFWKEHLSLNNIDLWHWQTPQQGVDNVTTVWPDIIIIDGYWAKESFKPYLETILKLNINTKLYCLTPKAGCRTQLIPFDKRLTFSKFSSSFINEVNNIIAPKNVTKSIQLNQSA